MKFGQLPEGFSVRFYEPRDREAVLALEKRQGEILGSRGVEMLSSDPDDPLWAAICVVVDETDRPVAAVGARRIVEVGVTFDPDEFRVPTLVAILARAWAKLAVTLYRRGYDFAYCRAVAPDGKWGNMLEKRAAWRRITEPSYAFFIQDELKKVRRDA